MNQSRKHRLAALETHAPKPRGPDDRLSRAFIERIAFVYGDGPPRPEDYNLTWRDVRAAIERVYGGEAWKAG